MEYVIFYLILGSLIPLALSFKTRNRISFLDYQWNIPIIVAVLIVILVRAYAYNTGTDYIVYYENYLYKGNTIWGENREIGFKWLNFILHLFSDSPQLFFGFAAFVYMYAILMVSQLFGKADKWIVFFWSVILFVLSYNLYRQYFSLSFILLGYYWFEKKNYVTTCILSVLAVSFHTSAVVGIAFIVGIYLIRHKYIDRKYLMLAMIATTVFSSIIQTSFLNSFSFISNWYAQETGKLYTTTNILDSMYDRSVLAYPSMIANLIFIWYGDKMVKEKPTCRFIFYVFSFAVILNPITNQEILMRIRLYVDVFIPLLLGMLAYRYNRIYRYPMLWIAFIFLFAKFVYGLYHLGSVHPLQFKF